MHPKIIDDPSLYGTKEQSWATEFVVYMKEIVTHPVYEGMPDAIKNDGKIQWEAPSNRSSGIYQFTYNKRLDWWKAKAKSIKIDTSENQWISRTAKLIHPTGKKPCKRCGKTMQIAYSYPQASMIKRLKKHFGADFEVSTFESITDIVQRIYNSHGDQIFEKINDIFSAKNIEIPNFNRDVNGLITWITNDYIPQEPSLLSPGVMSNAPDRFDGFHSFNRCCRGKADTGRHISNLKSYVTDRRVFEFWSEGDWIAADRLMGLVKTKLKDEACFDGGKGSPTPDHIGPLSLGFCHQPRFKLLSKSANSAKNNRLTFSDIQYLIKCETNGGNVISWYAKPLWDIRKHDIDGNEQSLRFSKMLRDNQRNAMNLLCKVFEAKKYAFLVYLLELQYADREIEFENLRAIDFFTIHDNIIEKPRATKYSDEQKSRRIRIGFHSLKEYKFRENRHFLVIAQDKVNGLVKKAVEILDQVPNDLKKLDDELEKILHSDSISEENLRNFAKKFPLKRISEFDDAKGILANAMEEIGQVINSMWNDERYSRDEEN
jgi:Alw26I/Eco31I/Esp3I family type II restriction endonuclease